MKNKRFRFTFYSVAVLIVILIVALRPGKGDASILFDKNSPITLYARMEEGNTPEFDAADYFPEEELDAEKFSYDWTDCNFDVPGTYTVPVFYDGKRTVCAVSLEVRENEEPDVDKVGGGSETGTADKVDGGNEAGAIDKVGGGNEAGAGSNVSGGIDGGGREAELRNLTGGESTEER